MFFFKFPAYLELFECVRNFFDVDYMLRCRVHVPNYNFMVAMPYVSIDTLRVALARRTLKKGSLELGKRFF